MSITNPTIVTVSESVTDITVTGQETIQVDITQSDVNVEVNNFVLPIQYQDAVNTVVVPHGTIIVGTDTLTVSGGTGVATSVTGDTITIDIGQAVATTSNVTFNNVTVDGTLTSDDITASTMTASGHVVVQGNLTVNGTTTTVNSNTVAIGDSIMTLNNDETGTPSENAGFEIERGTSTNVSLLWNEGTDYWQINDGSTTSKIMTAGNFAASFTGILDGGSF